MGASLDDLIALVKQRGTEETFPEKEELHGLLEPFRELPDQESVRLALAAAVRKGDRLVARVASEALAFLGREAGAPLLVGLALDDALATSQRAAAVWALDHHLPGYREHLAPHEQSLCFNLPVFEMLEDPEADQGFGLKTLLGSYSGMSAAARDGFLSAIAHAARERGHRMAGLCTHLLTAEDDGERRGRLLDLVAADATQEAVDLLATFAARTADSDDAKRARRHLHLLRGKGLRGVVKADLRESRALVTGVDGDACFSVNLIIPRVPTFDLVNMLFHLESGLRDGFLMENLPGRNVDELVTKVKEGCGTVCSFIPMPLAARIVDEAMAATKPGVLEDRELARVVAMAEPALAEARAQDYTEPSPPTAVKTTAQEAGGLLASPGFESWFFERREGTVQKALKAMGDPILAKGKAAAKAFANRVTKATEDLRARLRADHEHLRLQRMLRHQARLLEHGGDADRAALCRKLAVEVEEPESIFLTNMAARAIFDGLRGPGEDERPSRFAEARVHLRARLAHEEHAHRKREVAYLDMAAAAHTEIAIRNREAPSAQRAPLAVIENAALAVGVAFVDGLQGNNISELLARVEKVLEEHQLFPAADRPSVTQAIVGGMSSFMDNLCEGECSHRCFENLNGDGRAAFYAEGLPWLEPTGGPVRRGRNEA